MQNIKRFIDENSLSIMTSLSNRFTDFPAVCFESADVVGSYLSVIFPNYQFRFAVGSFGNDGYDHGFIVETSTNSIIDFTRMQFSRELFSPSRNIYEVCGEFLDLVQTNPESARKRFIEPAELYPIVSETDHNLYLIHYYTPFRFIDVARSHPTLESYLQKVPARSSQYAGCSELPDDPSYHVFLTFEGAKEVIPTTKQRELYRF